MFGTPRREFLRICAGITASAAPLAAAARSVQPPARSGALAIASGNGLRAASAALEAVQRGGDPADAVVEGVAIIEDDPTDMTVGLGGLPNEQGVVQLDASVMDGRLHRAGSVACLEKIRNPAAVALRVLRRTDHVLLVGAGALEFARAQGFKEENLLTEEAREAWLQWKSSLSPDDDWLDPEQQIGPDGKVGVTRRQTRSETGTVHCSVLTPAGDVAGCTSTSGLSWKIPGRVGDSPIIGAGLYVDNEVGAAGATGRGEAVLQSCGAFSVVERMSAGLSPEEACVEVLRRIARRTKERRLLDAAGRPNFNVTMYALRTDGAFGSACLLPGGTFAVATAGTAEVRRSRVVFE